MLTCDDALFGYDDDPAADAMIAAANALERRDIVEARVALAAAERWQPTAQIGFEALSLLDDGRPDEAARRIDLFLHPKWPSVAACAEAYEQAMGARS